MTQPGHFFGVVAAVLTTDNRHYAVITNWGQRIEATYYRSDVASFDVGDHVFLERVGASSLWMISSHAFGSPTSTGSMGWFQVDNDTFGLVDGPGRIVP